MTGSGDRSCLPFRATSRSLDGSGERHPQMREARRMPSSRGTGFPVGRWIGTSRPGKHHRSQGLLDAPNRPPQDDCQPGEGNPRRPFETPSRELVLTALRRPVVGTLVCFLKNRASESVWPPAVNVKPGNGQAMAKPVVRPWVSRPAHAWLDRAGFFACTIQVIRPVRNRPWADIVSWAFVDTFRGRRTSDATFRSRQAPEAGA